MARDYTRKRVYLAEQAAERRLRREERRGETNGRAIPPRITILDDEDVQPFADRVCAYMGIEPVEVELVPQQAHAHMERETRTMKLPPWARNDLTILHELGHVVIHLNFPSHGAEYLSAYLELLERFMPEPVARYFREAFEDEGLELEPSPKQALRFLSYARRKNARDPIYLITSDGRLYTGILEEYDRPGGKVYLRGLNGVSLERLRYASWQKELDR